MSGGGRGRRVFVTGGDRVGWALDEAVRLTRRALEGLVDLVDDPASCDVVHSISWRPLLTLDRRVVEGRRVLCYAYEEVARVLREPMSLPARAMVGRWLAGTVTDAEQFTAFGLESTLIPFVIDTDVFRPLADRAALRRDYAARWGIPTDRYLIGSFQRDTEGADLVSPKRVKGPDVFAEIVRGLVQRGLPIHVVLAGPRRFWLRRRLSTYGIPYTFVGPTVNDGDDDLEANSLERDALNALYNVIDLYVVASRSEGGPMAILEAAATKTAIVTPRLGLAPDVLDPALIYAGIDDAVEKIAADIAVPWATARMSEAFQRIAAVHTAAAVRRPLAALYERIAAVPPVRSEPQGAVAAFRPASVWRRWWRRAVPESLERRPTVGLWTRLQEPPYGGANQFMLALAGALRRRGHTVRDNVARGVGVHLLQAVWFDIERFRRARGASGVPVIHRVAGPISLARGFDREKDDLCFALNAEVASVTVFQSAWSLAATLGLGYRPVAPIVIPNSADPAFFHAEGRLAFRRARPVRLIATSWSDNERKGHDIYRWLEDHLDPGRFELTFVGRTRERFVRAHVIPPVGSEELGRLLRAHDVFLFASRVEASSNALVEALACGLPALYAGTSSNPEVVGFGGLPFMEREEIPEQLERLVAHYEAYQAAISVPTLEETVDRYVEIIDRLARAG